MNSSVILLVINEEYLPHAKALMAGCRRQGNWVGDFCVMCPADSELRELQERGITVIYTPDECWGHIIKFRMFSRQMIQWKQVLYLDCDCIVQGDLNRACEKEAVKFPSILCDNSHDAAILKDWEHSGKMFTGKPHIQSALCERLLARFPHVATERLLCSNTILFRPEDIPRETVQQLFAIHEEFREANPSNFDQAVINTVLHGHLAPLSKDFVCWFIFDRPDHRIPEAMRGWTGTETPAILHYWHTYAPWIEKEPGVAGYFNDRLGRICHELYRENLALFDDTFPKRA